MNHARIGTPSRVEDALHGRATSTRGCRLDRRYHGHSRRRGWLFTFGKRYTRLLVHIFDEVDIVGECTTDPSGLMPTKAG